ncbi:MAG: DEAD/DEAH box helicase [Pirellulales bacterium]
MPEKRRRRRKSTSATDTPAVEAAGASGFASLGLSAATLEALGRAGYEQPTPIQQGLIPLAISGVDVLGQAQTGTGKTASFVIPILERLDPRQETQSPMQAICLVPTRELAVQVTGEFEKLSHGRKVSTIALYGGKPIRNQITKLKRKPEVAVGTPGRVLDHIGRGTLDLSGVRIVVLDEADRMLDIGFRPDIEKILRRCPSERQTLLLSATVPPPVERLARRYMKDPETLNFSPKDISVETIDQYYFTVDNDRKFPLLLKLMEREQPQQSIIFCRTKRRTDRIARQLGEHVKNVSGMHGDLAQNVRDRVMTRFREGKIAVLVATDVVGRGIDVSGISHIINFDIPEFCDDYVHRVGAHRADGTRRRRLHPRHPRRGPRTDADRDADQSSARTRRTGRFSGDLDRAESAVGRTRRRCR